MSTPNLDLREYLAGQALAGLLSNPQWNPHHGKRSLDDHFAFLGPAALAAADALLTALRAEPDAQPTWQNYRPS